MKTFPAALTLVLALGAPPVLAANARHPYSNIDRRVDKGGDTGDSRVEALNQQQLDAARAGNTVGAPMAQPVARPVARPMMGAPLMQPGAGR